MGPRLVAPQPPRRLQRPDGCPGQCPRGSLQRQGTLTLQHQRWRRLGRLRCCPTKWQFCGPRSWCCTCRQRMVRPGRLPPRNQGQQRPHSSAAFRSDSTTSPLWRHPVVGHSADVLHRFLLGSCSLSYSHSPPWTCASVITFR